MGGATSKTLIPLDDQEPMLHYILTGLHRAGITDLVVVTGFVAQDVKNFVTEHWAGDEPKFAFNARYASWGNFHSVRVALDQSPGADALIVNCDVVVHPDVYRRVAEAPGDLVLAVQRRPRLDDEDMRVRLKGDRVIAIGKDLRMSLSDGEYAGVSLIRSEAARAYLDIATESEWTSDTDGYYEGVYAAMLPAVDSRAVEVKEDEYAEVDEPSDVAAAQRVIEAHRHAWSDEPENAGERT
jgi:choline kinase